MYATDDTRARDKLASMARRSVLAARHGWMRSTGLARCRTRCPHAALRSHCDGLWIAHRSWADRARTFTTVGGGAGTPPSAELQQKHRDLRSRALHEAATEALADHWAGMRHALVPRRARTQWTDAASERSNAASGSSGSPVDVAGSKSVATSGPCCKAVASFVGCCLSGQSMGVFN